MACSAAEATELSALLANEEAARFLCARLQSKELADAAAAAAADAVVGLDGMFVLFSAYLVFVMQAGFAMLTAGSVRTKNCMNALLKNTIDAAIAGLAFFLFGYGFAFGSSTGGNSFIGDGLFALHDLPDVPTPTSGYQHFLFQWAFAAAAATIVSGAVAERCSFQGYVMFSAILTGFVYPCVAHWVWHPDGWLGAGNSDPLLGVGMVDFAGSAVVHMVGGISGLCGAVIIGPRSGRFDNDGKPKDGFRGHSAPLVCLGTFLLWFGWYGFNPGSMLVVHGSRNLQAVGRTAVNTTLSACSAAIVSLLLNKLLHNKWCLSSTSNGLLGGLVSITASCALVHPWAAIVCGAVGAAVQLAASVWLLRCQVDDPLDAVSVHAACGVWGCLWLGLVAEKDLLVEVYGAAASTPFGALRGGGGDLLACQVIGVAVVAAWTAGIMSCFFALVHYLGLLRVTERQEEMGLDLSYHGGAAYEQLVAEGASGSGGSSGLGRRAIGPGGDVVGVVGDVGARGACSARLPLPRCQSAPKAEPCAAPSTPPA